MAAAFRLLRAGASWLLLALFAALAAGCVGAPAVEEAAATPDTPAGIITAAGFRAEQVGYLLRDLDSGAVVAAHNADDLFMPASVAKVPTAIAALEVLGGRHRFVTRVVGTTAPRDGVVAGDLVLVGGGDPLLGPDGLLALCRQLHDRGVRRIKGRLLYDATRYPARPAIAADQPPDARYNPGIAALALDFNRLRVVWGPGAKGREWQAESLPPLPAVAFATAARPLPDGQVWAPEAARTRTLWRRNPDAPPEGRTWLPIKHPARVTAQVFRRLCGQVGVMLPAPRPGRRPAAARVLARHPSPPLAGIVQAMLKYSNNLVAELVGQATSCALRGEGLPLPASAAAVGRWWRDRLPGVDWTGFAPGNHSGLNAAGRASPAQVAAMLAHAHGRRYATPGGGSRSLPDLLPAAGWDGGLGTRLETPEAALRVWAKTGTMHYASGLAGYLFTDGGRRMAFAVFVNDRAARRAYDAAEDRRAPARQGAVATWRRRAKALEARLLRHWLRGL